MYADRRLSKDILSALACEILGLEKASEHFQILHILFEVFFLGSFQDLRDQTELRSPHDLGKGRQTNFALADMLMPVNMGSKTRFGVVQMPSGKPFSADELIEFFYHLPESLFPWRCRIRPQTGEPYPGR
jgi:hypothetical protein